MNARKFSLIALMPVMFSFFVMSFCDLVGIGVDNAKKRFPAKQHAGATDSDGGVCLVFCVVAADRHFTGPHREA